eukprot:SAG11_NODE_22416_length_406_cov_1.166124_1_plen_65_part_00
MESEDWRFLAGLADPYVLEKLLAAEAKVHHHRRRRHRRRRRRRARFQARPRFGATAGVCCSARG